MSAGFRQAIMRVLLEKLKVKTTSIEAQQLTQCIQWVPDFHQNRVVVRLPVSAIQDAQDSLTPANKMVELVPGWNHGKQLKDIQWLDEDEKLSFSIPINQFCKHVVDDINLFPNDFWKSASPHHCQNVVIEFSSPNLAKPFHFGHLRSTIIGNFLANLHQTLGDNVTRLNYLGDWGTQYGLLGVGLKTIESKNTFPENPIDRLLQVYVRMNAVAQTDPSILDQARDHFRLMEAGNTEALQQWTTIRELSVDYLRNTYKRLGVEFDEYHAESMYSKGAKDVVKKCDELGILLKCDGALAVEAENAQQAKPIVLCKSDGSSVYLSRDIAAAIDRKNRYNFDKMYYVVESGQTSHFEAMNSILKKMGMEWHNTFQHVKFGLIVGMSTRKGNAVFLKDVIDEAQNRMLECMKSSPNTRATGAWEQVAETLGLSAIVVNDLQKRRQRAYNFNWDEVIKIKGNPGVQFQYTHARLCSLLDLYEDKLNIHTYDSDYTKELSGIYLIECLSRYNDTLTKAYEQLQPCIFVTYLLELRSLANTAHKALKVKDEPEDLAQARLCVFKAAQTVLNHGMKLLGLNPLRQM